MVWSPSTACGWRECDSPRSTVAPCQLWDFPSQLIAYSMRKQHVLPHPAHRVMGTQMTMTTGNNPSALSTSRPQSVAWVGGAPTCTFLGPS